MSPRELEKEATAITKISPNRGIKEDKRAGRVKGRFINISGNGFKYK